MRPAKPNKAQYGYNIVHLTKFHCFNLVFTRKGFTFASHKEGNWVPALVLESFVLLF